MATNISGIVDLLHPTVSGIGVITTDQVWVLFDRELDEDSVSAGNFFLTGPDFDTWSGPDLQLYLDRDSFTSEEEILQSPGYYGIVQGEITFQRIANDSLNVVTTKDTVGSGHLYRTKAIFTPTNRLQVSTEYLAYISGDEDATDSLLTGLSSRTVYDVVASGANTGTGSASFTGGYIGNIANDTYRVAITTSGEVGTSKFQFSRDSDPLSLFGPFRTKKSGILLSDGVTVAFTEGTYVVGDQWSVVVKEREVYNGNLVWPFKTGSGSIATVPTSTSTSVIGDPVVSAASSSSSSSLTTFSVASTSPLNEASNVDIPTGSFAITATFNNNIDASTVVSGVSAVVYSESVTGESSIPASGVLIYSPSVSGKVLTLSVRNKQLKQNNLVTVTLDKDIKDTNGNSLGSDYEFWFTTEYYPMYCTYRLVNIRVGAFINDLKEDTVNLALFAASREAEMMTWNKDNLDDDYYQFVRGQWTCCRAAHILLTNTVGASGAIKSKRLGDLAVEYNTSSDVNKPLQLTEECLMKWEGALMAGGRQVQTAQMVVKGELDPDRPPVGRNWLYTRDIHHGQTPAANRRVRPFRTRRYRNVYTRATYPKGWWNK